MNHLSRFPPPHGYPPVINATPVPVTWGGSWGTTSVWVKIVQETRKIDHVCSKYWITKKSMMASNIFKQDRSLLVSMSELIDSSWLQHAPTAMSLSFQRDPSRWACWDSNPTSGPGAEDGCEEIIKIEVHLMVHYPLVLTNIAMENHLYSDFFH